MFSHIVRNLQCGGAVLEVKTKQKKIFTQNLDGFCARKQVKIKKKKNGLHPKLGQFLSPKTREDKKATKKGLQFYTQNWDGIRAREQVKTKKKVFNQAYIRFLFPILLPGPKSN